MTSKDICIQIEGEFLKRSLCKYDLKQHITRKLNFLGGEQRYN